VKVCRFCNQENDDSAVFCKHCRRHLVTGIKGGAKPHRMWPLWVLLIVVVVWGIGALINQVQNPSQSGSASNSEKCGPEDTDAAAIADTLLEEWKDGNSGGGAWEDGIPMKKLFNVTEWKRLDAVYPVKNKTNASAWTFRVQSTTQGGIAITQTWNVWVEQSGSANVNLPRPCKVYDITEAQ